MKVLNNCDRNEGLRMSTAIEFTVYGRPVPQGSMRPIISKTTGRTFVKPSTNLLPWRQDIARTAMEMRIPIFDRHTPVEITMNFYFVRPKSAKKRPGMTVTPDSDKLVRACLDALKGIVIVDDAQVIEHHARKHYGGPERVEIRIQEAIV